MFIRLVLVSTLLVAATARADWIFFKDGQRVRVQSVSIGERAVQMTTLAGKPWSVLRSAVDVERTRAANAPEPEPREKLAVVTIEPPPPPAPPLPAVREPPPAPPAAPPPAPPAPPVTPIAPRRSEPMPEPGRTAPRFSISLNGAVGTEAFVLFDVNRFELFKEEARIESRYRERRRPQGLELQAQYRIAGPFAVSGAFERFRSDRDAVFRASLPHPFFFDRFRELSGTESGLTYEENAVHVDAVFTRTWGFFTLDGFAGPSWFQTRTEVLTDVVYDETFPFNDVTFEGVEARIFESRPIGYNAGAGATFRLGGIFGINLRVRYSRARTELVLDDGRAIELEAGGLRLGAGLRFLFP